VVALESTVIAQGLPWPENLEVARAMEGAVRAAGAVPATLAVLRGCVHVGIDASGMEGLAHGSGVLKAGRRDLSWAVSQGLDAAVTVSASVWLARQVGIGVFATGGIGGVHREAGATFDISCDLDELARGDGVVVVCAGAKGILDLPATLEVLEARGVPVVGYQTDELPAFQCRTSGLPLEQRVETPAAAARVVRTHRELGLPGAVLLVQPVPEPDALEPAVFDRALAEALGEAAATGVRGKPLTPFLLERIRQATAGRSLAANRALLVANAALAGAIAVELAESR
jgi:pseudouridine-5'-phosphate glycosidase